MPTEKWRDRLNWTLCVCGHRFDMHNPGCEHVFWQVMDRNQRVEAICPCVGFEES